MLRILEVFGVFVSGVVGSFSSPGGNLDMSLRKGK